MVPRVSSHIRKYMIFLYSNFFVTCEKWGFVCITIGSVCARGGSHKLGQGQEQRTASRTQQYLSVCLFAKMRENFLCAWAKSDSTQRLRVLKNSRLFAMRNNDDKRLRAHIVRCRCEWCGNVIFFLRYHTNTRQLFFLRFCLQTFKMSIDQVAS